MKKATFILVFILFTITSCKIGSYSDRAYTVILQITDADENDLIKGVKYSISSTNNKYNSYAIIQSDYTCASKTDDINSYSSIKPDTDPQSILIHAATPPHQPRFKPDEIKVEMVCQHIFKDDEKHEIISKWVYPKNKSHYCTGVIFEGVEYPVVSGALTTDCYVKIILNRER